MPYKSLKKKDELGTAVPSSRVELGTRIGKVCELIGTRDNAANAAGLSVDQLTHYIFARAKPGFLALKGICAAAGVSMDWMATGKGEMLVKDRNIDGKVDESLLFDAIEAVEEYLADNNFYVEPKKKALLIRELIMITIEDEESGRVKITGKLSRLVQLAL